MLDVTRPVPFYPPRIKPAARPLRFPFNLMALVGNNLEAIPEAAFHQPIVVVPGLRSTVLLTGPELVKKVLLDSQADFPKGRAQNEMFRPLFGNAMFCSEGREWRFQRGTAAPLFRHDEIRRYGPTMAAAAEATVAKWRAAAPGTLHSIHNDMMHAAFAVISKTMLAGSAKDVIHAIEQGHADYYRGVNWWVLYTMLGLPHWLPRPGGRATRAHERRLRSAVADLVRARRNAGARAGAEDDDLMGRLLAQADPETGRTMPDERVVDNIVGFLVGGYDTTALALTWTLYLVSQSPFWEARMLEEIRRVAGSEPITAAHAAELVVVQQVLNESLRLYPPAPAIIRDFREDIELAGMAIRAGTAGIIPMYAIHRHRALWDDPDRFDPERFSPTRPKPTRYQFMPFGAGPRVCIGAAFAMMEATIMLATFIRAARFALPPGFTPEPSGQMFLLPKRGMPMRVALRERTQPQ